MRGGDRGGRKPSRLTPDVAQTMGELWFTDTPRYELSAMFGVSENRITVWARQLGLPPKQQPTRRDTHNIAQANRQRRVQREMEQLERLQIDIPEGGDRVTCWVCHAPSQLDSEGDPRHDSCRGRRKAA